MQSICWPGLRGLFAVLVCTAVAEAAPGCPFCPPTQPTFGEQLSQCDAACLVTWVGVMKSGSGEEVGSATTTFAVVDTLRTGTRKFPSGTKITVDFLRTGNPGDTFLLFGKEENDQIAWSAPVEMSDDSFQYIRQAPAFEAPTGKRLRYFLKFLEVGDQQIANDAFAEFSRARYEDVALLSSVLPKEKLRGWLAAEETTKIRLGFYGLLLGLCGNDDDAAFLEAQIFAPVAPDDVRLGIDGMMGGYLLLQRQTGLKRLVTRKLLVEETARTDLFALLNALRFAWEYGRDRVPEADLRAALRHYLDRDEFAELVLADLARWKDWTVLDRLIRDFGKEPFETGSAQLKIIQYAQACVKDAQGKTDPPAHVELAAKFLRRMETESPDLIRQTRRPAPLK